MVSICRLFILCGVATLMAACPSTDDGDDNSLCGNGILNPGEQCDDGNQLDHDGCSAACVVEGFCGNAVVEPGEECDDGNYTEGDGCSPECTTEVGCGNGRLEVGEQCDDDNLYNTDGCDALCQDEVPGALCGNGIHELGEGCDDGNTDNGDGCNVDCKREDGCGDGTVQPPELCDDGNTINGDGCSDACRVEFVCGNDYCEAENYETCYLCPADCCPDCGNEVLDEGEECDDGNNDNGDGCDKGCGDEDGTAVCGNGIWEAGEECEDGNTIIHDGCSDTCTVEFTCGDQLCETNVGENCQRCQVDCCPNCGNGVYEPNNGEECDLLDLGGQSCSMFGCQGGTLICTQWCTLDFAGCGGSQPTCGNDIAECFESCDASDLRGESCNSLGYDGGALSCDSGCNFETGSCGALLWYFFDDLEDPATTALWTLGGDWQSGTPSLSGAPTSAHSGTTVFGTVIGNNYSGSDTYMNDLAETPPINLAAAIAPMLRFYMWVNTEAFYDCGALFIDSGAGFQHTTASVPYNGLQGSPTVGCWEGTSTLAWQEVTKDLTAYVGQTIRIGFGFHSDSIFEYPGWYIDDVIVAEPGALP